MPSWDNYVEKINKNAKEATDREIDNKTQDGLRLEKAIIKIAEGDGRYTVATATDQGAESQIIEHVRPSNASLLFGVGDNIYLYRKSDSDFPEIFCFSMSLDNYSCFQSPFEQFGGLLAS